MNTVSVAPRHAAVLLAAGGSRRLGRPKQLLRRDGETLLHRMARILRATAPRCLLVVVGAHREAIVAALDDIECEVVVNSGWARGLAGSVQAAAAALGDEPAPVLIVGCDQPALSESHLQALLDGARASSAHCAAALHAGLPGIPVVVPGTWLSRVDADAGDRGFADRLRALPRDALSTLDAPELAFDLDTADDVATAVARGWLDPMTA